MDRLLRDLIGITEKADCPGILIVRNDGGEQPKFQSIVAKIDDIAGNARDLALLTLF